MVANRQPATTKQQPTTTTIAFASLPSTSQFRKEGSGYKSGFVQLLFFVLHHDFRCGVCRSGSAVNRDEVGALNSLLTTATDRLYQVQKLSIANAIFKL